MKQSPYAIVTVLSEDNPSTRRPGRSIKVECSECDYVAFTWVPASCKKDETRINRHLAQHGPGRALDIEVDWQVLAECSVCEYGGKVEADGEGGLTCEECGTYWDIDGSGGFLYDY